MRVREHVAVLGVLAGVSLCGACGPDAGERAAPGDEEHGREQIQIHGCGACHVIPGIRGARGQVGPPLADYARRAYIAGTLPNSPAALARFLQDPAAVRPDTAMPDLGLDGPTAEAMAAWLWRAP